MGFWLEKQVSIGSSKGMRCDVPHPPVKVQAQLRRGQFSSPPAYLQSDRESQL